MSTFIPAEICLEFLPVLKQLHSQPGEEAANQKPSLDDLASDWLSAGEIVPDDARPMRSGAMERGNQFD